MMSYVDVKQEVPNRIRREDLHEERFMTSKRNAQSATLEMKGGRREVFSSLSSLMALREKNI